MRVGFVLLLLLGLLFIAPAHTPAAARMSLPLTATATRVLPTHIGLGLAASSNTTGIYGWMPASHIPWDYAYQYLTGGVNTGHGWETWKSEGRFPLYYALGAASHHYIPVFSYYNLQMSIGLCTYCSESHRSLANLNDAHVMNAYFHDFALLMQRLGPGAYSGVRGFGKTAIVHVEPGLSGYAEQAVLDNHQCYGYCTGQGNNPALLAATVSRSGYKPVNTYANTYQGFSLALTHLRDLYAPNVLLAFHVSNWATTVNIGRDKSAAIDATALGREAGQFIVQSSVGGLPPNARGYDLIFNDVSDRDAAYDKYKQGYVSGNDSTWWDSLRACPQTPQLPGLVFDPTGTTSVVAGVAGGRARHPRAVAHPQERRGGGCGASGDRWWTQDRVWMAPTDPGIDQNVRGTGGRFVDTLLHFRLRRR